MMKSKNYNLEKIQKYNQVNIILVNIYNHTNIQMDIYQMNLNSN